MFDAIVIGAGASGFMCAASILKRGKKVLMLEHNDKPLKKVSISGGGNCNFTNLSTIEKNYLSLNNKFCISALKQFAPADFVKKLESHRIEYIEKNHRQLFCKSGSKSIINMLLAETKGLKTIYNSEVFDVKKENESFLIETNHGCFCAKNLIIATGGLSYPQIGASDFGHRIAKQFGLKIVPCRPALVPFNLDSGLMKDLIKLKGMSLLAMVKCGEFVVEENILFTHFGLSGPAILQTSLYWNKGQEIVINLLPKVNVLDLLNRLKNASKGKKISNILADFMPEKLVEYVVGSKDVFVTEASNKLIKEIASLINEWKVCPVGTQGFKLAEVTAGGVDVNEVSSKTFESKKVSGLFFVGEVLDVAGQLGGYNLQWAWSSGVLAGNFIGDSL